MDAIGSLLRIKTFRENEAELEVLRKRSALREAEQAKEREQRKLEEHRTFCEQKERALYADLCSRVVQKADIDKVSMEVDAMRDSIVVHERALASAESACAEAEENLEQAKLQHMEAIRAREKFSEMKTIVDAELTAERERFEDLELEEVRTGGPLQGGGMENESAMGIEA